MGWTFRKAKTFGPFRVTVSKRGLGGSVGVGPVRVTKRADGGLQRTVTVGRTGWRNTKRLD